MTPKEFLALADEDGEFEHRADLKVVQEGDWEIDYKDYASKATVYLHIPSGRYFDVTENRSGSYYSEYEYTDPDCYEVKPMEVTVTQYVVIK